MCSCHCKKIPENVLWFDNIISYEDWQQQINDQELAQAPKDNINKLSVQTVIKQTIKVRQVKCNCCMNDEFKDHEDDLIGCSSSSKHEFSDHYICKECLKRNVDIQLKTSVAKLQCVFHDTEKCNGNYSLEIIKSLLTWEEVEKYQEYLDLQLINELAAVCENYQICPLCKKYGCIVDNFEGWMYINCGTCKESWCSKCKEKSHNNIPCYTLNFTSLTKKEDMYLKIDRIINDLACEKLTHSCIRCKNKFIKDEGCNLMTCEKCGSMSCYICCKELFKDANGNKYGHFAGHPNSIRGAICPLWNNEAGDGKINQGNTEYNIKKIMNSMDEFMNVNTEKNIRLLIYNRVYETFRKESPKDIYKSHILKLGVKYKFIDETKLSNDDKRLLLNLKN
jgi:TRIAD3 protein (E3 ubiquitin-protein ligase RNF216)